MAGEPSISPRADRIVTALLGEGDQPSYWFYRRYGANPIRRVLCTKAEYDKHAPNYPGKSCDYSIRFGGYYEVDPDTNEETWVERDM